MLRNSLLKSRALHGRFLGSNCSTQWHRTQPRTPMIAFQQRFYADPPKTPDQTVLPGSQSTVRAANEPAPPKEASSTSSPSAIPAENVPKTPPSAEEVQSSSTVSTTTSSGTPTGAGTASVTPSSEPASSSSPSKPKRKPRRWRRFFLSLILLSGLGYAGGVYYSLISDNWHDFFTEYVPFGEDAVAYFEEREFRRRFPQTVNKAYPQIRGENKVTIPGKAGMSSKITDVSDESSNLGTKGRHTSALQENQPGQKKQAPSVDADKKKATESSKEATKKGSSKPAQAEPQKSEAKPPSSQKATAKSQLETLKPTESSKAAAPAAAIDPINVPASEEPVVQDVVKILNDIITVVNADNAASKYSSAISKARDDINKVVTDIATLKATEQKAAEDKIKANHTEFDNYARDLLSRVEREMRDQESRWKDEYESERARLSQSYQSRLAAELDSARALQEQKAKNALLDQSIAINRQLAADIAGRVETERAGRLAQLEELSASVAELEKLTADEAAVLDHALQTQHLHIAINAVRNVLAPPANARPHPFVAELAALKDLSLASPLVAAAIASIPPQAYQRGIPSPAALVERFRRVAAEVRKAGLLPAEAGVASHAVSWALSKATFKKEGVPTGDDVESVLARAETWLVEGRLEEAAREVNGLGGTARELVRDWLGECRRVLEVRQALEVVETEAKLQSLLVG